MPERANLVPKTLFKLNTTLLRGSPGGGTAFSRKNGTREDSPQGTQRDSLSFGPPLFAVFAFLAVKKPQGSAVKTPSAAPRSPDASIHFSPIRTPCFSSSAPLPIAPALPHSPATAMSRSKLPDPLQTSLLAVTQTAVGCAIGLLLAGKLGRPAQKATAASLLGVGALLALPAVVEAVTHAITGPGSARGEQRRLDSIRTDSGFPDNAEIL